MAFSKFIVSTDNIEKDSITINLKAQSVQGTLTGFFFIDKDTKQHVIYFPSLDVSGYGETRKKAEEMGKFSLEQLFDSFMLLSKSALDTELKKYGWEKNGIFNKQFSNAFVDINGALQNFNIQENSLSRITLTAA